LFEAESCTTSADDRQTDGQIVILRSRCQSQATELGRSIFDYYTNTFVLMNFNQIRTFV